MRAVVGDNSIGAVGCVIFPKIADNAVEGTLIGKPASPSNNGFGASENKLAGRLSRYPISPDRLPVGSISCFSWK
jgi:hypothetical protein